MGHNVVQFFYRRYIVNPSVFLVFILLLSPFIHRSNLEATIKKYDEVVSLGYSCQVAFNLQANGRRHSAYPFDWLVTPFHSLTSFIENEGANFFDRDKISVVEVLLTPQGAPCMLHVADLVYDIHSIHDFVAPDMANYEAIKEMFDRRVKRFFKLLKSDKKVLFIRFQLSRFEAEELDYLLHTFYPQLKYTIVAVNDDLTDQVDWGLKRVRNFYVQQFPGNWMGDTEKWKEILSQFSMIGG